MRNDIKSSCLTEHIARQEVTESEHEAEGSSELEKGNVYGRDDL
jgi:hypothetical protein